MEELLVVGQVEVLVDQMAGGVPEDALVVIADAFDVSNYLLSPHQSHVFEATATE